MEEISWGEIVGAIKNKWYIILISTILFVCIFFGGQKVKPPLYKSYAEVLVGTSDEYKDFSILRDTEKQAMNVQLIFTYKEIFESRALAQRLSDEIGEDAEKIQKRIKVEVKENTGLLKVDYTASSAEKSKNDLQSIIKNFEEITKEKMKINNVQILDETTISTAVNRSGKAELGIYILVSILLGLSIAIALEFNKPTIKTKQQLEAKTKTRVLVESKKAKEDAIEYLMGFFLGEFNDKKSILFVNWKERDLASLIDKLGEIKIKAKLVKATSLDEINAISADIDENEYIFILAEKYEAKITLLAEKMQGAIIWANKGEALDEIKFIKDRLEERHLEILGIVLD